MMSSDLGLSVSWIGAMSSSGGSWSVLVDWRFVFSWSRWPLTEASLCGRFLDMGLLVNPGQVDRNCLRRTYRMVGGRGLNRAAV